MTVITKLPRISLTNNKFIWNLEFEIDVNEWFVSNRPFILITWIQLVMIDNTLNLQYINDFNETAEE